MAERGYINVEGLPDGVIPLPADALVEVWIGGKNYRVPYGELGGAPSSHATSHQDGGPDEIANSTPGAGVIPKADGSGTLNDWISPATTTTAGKVVLAADGEWSASKPPASNDSRLSDARYPTVHGSSHTNGSDQIPNATPTIAGLMSAEDKAAFDAYDPGNLPSDDEKAALAGTYGTPSGTNRYVTDDDPRIETLAIPPTLSVSEEAMYGTIPMRDFIDRIKYHDKVYVSTDGYDIYEDTGSALVPTGQMSNTWRFFEIYNDELYCTTYNGDIYKMDVGGIFQPTGQPSRLWKGIKTWNGGLHAVTYGGDLYLMDGIGVFNATGILSARTNKNFGGMDVDHVTGNLLVAVNGAPCLTITTGGVISEIGLEALDYVDICDDGTHLWAVTQDTKMLLKYVPTMVEFMSMYHNSYQRHGVSSVDGVLVVLALNTYQRIIVENHEDKNIIIPHGYVQIGIGFATGNDLCIRSTEGDIYVDLTEAGDTIDGAGFIEIESEGFVHIQKMSDTEWAYCSSSNYAELSPSIPAIRIAALIDETTSADVAATYAVVSNVCTITLADHGHRVNHIVYLDFTSGGGVDGWYIITGVSKNTFTVAMTVANTSGNVTLKRRTVTKGVGIHSASGVAGAGGYAVAINFEEAAPDANFWYSYGCGTRAGVYAACVKEYETVGTTSRTNSALCLMGISHTTSTTWTTWDFNKLSVQIFW